VSTTTRPDTGQPVAADPESGLLGIPRGDERLLTLVALAAPFADRAAREYFTPAKGSRRVVAQRSARWLAAAVGTGPEAATATTTLLRHRERTGRDLGAGLVDVVVTDPTRLPDWAYALVEFLLAQPLTADVDPATGYVGAPLMAFRRAANRLVDMRGDRLRGIRVADEGREDIAGQLIERLTTACDGALGFEYDLVVGPAKPAGHTWAMYDKFDVSRAGWLERMESLPGLAHLIGVTCLQWRTVIRELFDRLYTDLPDLRRALWQWRDPGPLISYSGDSGDLHDHGRVVSLLTFESGERVVYKPKNLDTVVAFNDLLTYLNTHGAPSPLSTRLALNKGDYGWEEYVRSSDCAGTEEFGGFYFRLGELARVVQLLQARDFWADNLIALGPHPVFIDLECLLQSRPTRTAAQEAVRGDELWERLEEGPSRTAVVSMARPLAPGRRYQDIGCMAALEEQIAEDSTGFPPGWEAPRYRPRTEDTVADPRQFHAEFLAGYQAMSEFLTEHADYLTDVRGPLGLLRDAPVRYVWRNTFDCTSIIRGSLGPAALSSGVAREMVLARTLRGFVPLLAEGDSDAREDILEILEQEIDAFRRLDVPLFLAKPVSTAAYTPEGTSIPEHFSGAAWDRLLDRLHALTSDRADAELAADTDEVAAMLWISAGEAETEPDEPRETPNVQRMKGMPVYKPGELRTEIGEDELVAAAVEVGDTVLASARELSGERLGWTGLVQYPTHGMPVLEPLHGDLLSGTGGIGVFLAELYRNTGKPAYWTGSRQALESTIEFAEHATGTAVHRWLAGPGAAIGGFIGLGGACYALARGADALGEPGLALTAAGLISRAAAPAGQLMAADVITGAAGQLLAFRALRAAAPTAPDWPEWTELLTERLRRQLAAGPDVSCHPYPAGWRLAELMPSGWAGVRYAAAVLAADGAELDSGSTWPIDGELAIATAYALAGSASAAEAPVPAAVPEALRGWSKRLHTLSGAQVLAVGELAWTVATAFDLDEFRPLAHRCARALLSRQQRHGSYFPERGAPDSLMFSAINGSAAVGLFVLRLCDEDMPDLRLLW
jgi:hypothetical protein